MGGLDVSVVIATRNRSGSLARTLDLLEAQEIRGFTWECIVVDNASDDDTSAMLAARSTSLPLRVLVEPEIGKSRALNRALAVAQGELLVFTDDDVAPVRYWLCEVFEASRRNASSDWFGGPISPAFPNDCPGFLRKSVFAGPLYSAFVPTLQEEDLSPHVIPLGPNFAVRRAAMDGLRFDPTLGPQGQCDYAIGCDVDFGLQLVARGHRARFIPKAIVRHAVRPEQIEREWVLQRCFRWGRGSACLYPEDLPLRIESKIWHAWLRASTVWSQYTAPPSSRLPLEMRLAFARGLLSEQRAIAARPRVPHVAFDAKVARELRRQYLRGHRSGAPPA